MPKLKVRKSVKKRFKVTKNGLVLHRSHGMRHKRTNKSKSQVRRLKTIKKLHSTIAIKVKKLLGK